MNDLPTGLKEPLGGGEIGARFINSYPEGTLVPGAMVQVIMGFGRMDKRVLVKRVDLFGGERSDYQVWSTRLAPIAEQPSIF